MISDNIVIFFYVADTMCSAEQTKENEKKREIKSLHRQIINGIVM